MSSPCTQNTDRECREEDCCLKESKPERICQPYIGPPIPSSYIHVCVDCGVELFISHYYETKTVFRILCLECYNREKTKNESIQFKKTRIVAFDYDLFKHEKVPAILYAEDIDIIDVFPGPTSLGYKYIIIFLECGKVTSRHVNDEQLRLHKPIEEKTFYINLYENFYTQSLIRYWTLDDAIKNRDDDSLGTLKVTYTNEDLIK